MIYPHQIWDHLEKLLSQRKNKTLIKRVKVWILLSIQTMKSDVWKYLRFQVNLCLMLSSSITIALAIFSTSIHSEPTCECGRFDRTLERNFGGRIFNGRETIPHRYPWQVFIVTNSYRGLEKCGGILISRKHVLTA